MLTRADLLSDISIPASSVFAGCQAFLLMMLSVPINIKAFLQREKKKSVMNLSKCHALLRLFSFFDSTHRIRCANKAQRQKFSVMCVTVTVKQNDQLK